MPSGIQSEPVDSAKATLKSLAKVVMVLDCFSRGRATLTPAEVAQRLGLPRATTHRLMASLREVGLLQQGGRRDGYKLGMKLFQLGSLVLAELDLTNRANPYVVKLQHLTGETIHLCVFDGSQMAYVDRQEMSVGQPLSTITRIAAATVYSTGVGKAFLAFQSDLLIRKIIADGLHPQTANTITDAELLLRDLAATRRRGYAIDNGENEPDVRCVAAPIRDAAGNVFAAISVSGPAARMPDERIAGLAPTVIATAAEIEGELGWDGK